VVNNVPFAAKVEAEIEDVRTGRSVLGAQVALADLGASLYLEMTLSAVHSRVTIMVRGTLVAPFIS
jgi:hypothetical protein